MWSTLATPRAACTLQALLATFVRSKPPPLLDTCTPTARTSAAQLPTLPLSYSQGHPMHVSQGEISLGCLDRWECRHLSDISDVSVTYLTMVSYCGVSARTDKSVAATPRDMLKWTQYQNYGLALLLVESLGRLGTPFLELQVVLFGPGCSRGSWCVQPVSAPDRRSPRALHELSTSLQRRNAVVWNVGVFSGAVE